jgi:hypothetical protein
MNAIAYGISVVVILAGAVFAFQGLRLLPSQVMYGKAEWIVIGGAMVLAGAAPSAFTALRAARRNRQRM